MIQLVSEKAPRHESYRLFGRESEHFDSGPGWDRELDSAGMGELRTSRDDGASRNLAVFVVFFATGVCLAITLAWLGRVILLLINTHDYSFNFTLGRR